MNQRPFSVTLIGYLFLIAGAVGFFYHLPELIAGVSAKNDAVWVCLIRLLAIVGGVFMLKGRNWARWLLLVWLAYHVVLAAKHDVAGFVIHALLLIVIAYLLLRRPASLHFQNAKPRIVADKTVE